MAQENNIQQQPQESNSQVFKVRGMKTDFSESSFENSFAFENKNMRINIVDEDNTLLNLTNEKGTKYIGSVKGIPVGIKKYDNDKVLLVTTENTGSFDVTKRNLGYGIQVDTLKSTSDFARTDMYDRFYVIETAGKEISISNIQTSNNNLTNLSAVNPLEIEHYSNGDTDYFYAVDGQNNFKSFWINGNNFLCNNQKLEYNDYTITGKERISVSNSQSTVSEFMSGAIVYCFSYINKQGHKTGIIDVSDVEYIIDSNTGVGLEPNKKSNTSMFVSINNVSTAFDFIEIYSLFRSALDGNIICKKVCKLKIDSSLVRYNDLNLGETISYQELVSRMNSPIIPSTITQKNSTLFLGNITTNNYSNIKKLINEAKRSDILISDNHFLEYNQYFYGVQLQDSYGNWSPVLYIGTKLGEASSIKLTTDFVNEALQNEYVSVRGMILDNRRIRNVICEGLATPTISIENAKYGIDNYSNYFYTIKDEFGFEQDIYNGSERIKEKYDYADVYSPDIEFDENLIIARNQKYYIQKSNVYSETLYSHNIDVEISGNIGTLYNADSSEYVMGKAGIDNNKKYYYWGDAIVGYQKSLQLFLWNGKYPNNGEGNIEGKDMFLSLYELNKFRLQERPSKYRIYTWQPSGSLNDSDGNTSILKSKRISRRYDIDLGTNLNYQNYTTYCFQFDKSTNNIPLKQDSGSVKVYGGNVNHKLYPLSWSIDKKYMENEINSEKMWDDDQIENCDGYALATLSTFSFLGQPIEIYRNLDDDFRCTYMYSTLGKLIEDLWSFELYVKIFRGKGNTSLGVKKLNFWPEYPNTQSSTEKFFNTTIKPNNENPTSKSRRDYVLSLEETNEVDNNTSGYKNYLNYPIKTRVTNKYNRPGSINIAYNSARHIVASGQFYGNYNVRIKKTSNSLVSLNNSDIETGQWIICSENAWKSMLEFGKECVINIDIKESYKWDSYECLKSEPRSLSDENQVTCCLNIKNVNSYINPLCRYDNLRGLTNFNGVTSSIFNKINMVYNQKNNFFLFMGFTDNTVTDDFQENAILFSGMKTQNESEDTFVNFNSTNYYTIDSNVKKINKLVTYNDKILCFSDDSIVHVLYNENVVIDTDSVQSLGLASSNTISGSQLISNTYGCLNKWSIGICDNVLYFNDDINNKIMSFSEGFNVLNEQLGIETLNNRLLKNKVWNPVDFGNTKLNIDKYSKDIHYIGNDIDISLNTTIGSFMSLFSYENVSYIETVGKHSIAIKGSNVYALREGEYNYFFGKFEPYWTTVVLNNNSLLNKAINNIEFSTEAYKDMNPDHNFTFDTLSFWNDYQKNKIGIDFKMYGISNLKKKFRIWRVNMFRNESRLKKRDYDLISNPWTYLKLSCENENTDKLTLHWINIKYR